MHHQRPYPAARNTFAPVLPQFRKGILWRGVWSNTKFYNIDDAVSYDGSSYIAIQSNSNDVPDVNTQMWNILAQEGEPGVQGTSFFWEGVWAPNTAYNVGNVVQYNGSAYTVVTAVPSNNVTTPDASSSFQLMVAKGQAGSSNTVFVWRGPYNANTTYSTNDTVSYNGSSYIATASIPTNSAPTVNSSWNLMAQEGSTGATGAPGVYTSGTNIVVNNGAGTISLATSVTGLSNLQTNTLTVQNGGANVTGGLVSDTLSVSGTATANKIAINKNSPTETLDVNGGIRVGYSTNTNAGTLRYNGNTGQVEAFTPVANNYVAISSVAMAGPGISAMVSYGKVIVTRTNGVSVATDGGGCNLSLVPNSFYISPVKFAMQYTTPYTTQLVFMCNNSASAGNVYQTKKSSIINQPTQVEIAVYSPSGPLLDFPQDGVYEFDIVAVGY